MSAARAVAEAGLAALLEAMRPLIREEVERARAEAGPTQDDGRVSYTVPEVATKTGMKLSAVRTRIRLGQLRATRQEGQRAYLVTPAALQEFLDGQAAPEPAPPVDLAARTRARLDRSLAKK